jgi:hypothetical protein
LHKDHLADGISGMGKMLKAIAWGMSPDLNRSKILVKTSLTLALAYTLNTSLKVELKRSICCYVKGWL